MASGYLRGSLFRDVDNGRSRIQVLGGPTFICGTAWYTVILHDGAELLWPPQEDGVTLLWSQRYLDVCDFIGVARVEKDREPFIVPVGHCPECDEPDMIFYNEDYICAWCREHLET